MPHNFDTAIVPILALTLLFSIIELGLSAYAAATATEYVTESVWDPNFLGIGYGGYDHFGKTVSASPPGPVSFLIFTSLWTMILSCGLLVLSLLSTKIRSKKAFWTDVYGTPASWTGPLTLALNTLTMVFWLAGFAVLSVYFGGSNPVGVADAMLAFAIMLWLIFLAVVVFNVLIALGIAESKHVRYTRAIFKKHMSSPGANISVEAAGAEKPLPVMQVREDV